MKKVDLSKVREVGVGGKKLPAGGYVIKILKCTDVPEYNRLDFYFDIAEGEFKNFYNDRYKNNPNKDKKWVGRFSKSYDANNERALPFFKQFVTTVQDSNKGFVWDEEHEQQFVNKIVGATFRDEEFVGQNGKVATSCKPDMFHSADKIRSGDFTIRELKKLDPSKLTTAQTATASAPIVNPFGDSEPATSWEENPYFR